MPVSREHSRLTRSLAFTRRGLLVVTGVVAASHIVGCTVEMTSTDGSGGTRTSAVAGAGGGAPLAGGGGSGGTPPGAGSPPGAPGAFTTAPGADSGASDAVAHLEAGN